MEIQSSCTPNIRTSHTGKEQPKWYSRDIAKAAIKDRMRAHRSTELHILDIIHQRDERQKVRGPGNEF